MTTLDDKTKKLLLKLRKGADASLSLRQLAKVLALLGGWTFEEVVGLTSMHGERGKESVWAQGEEAARRVHATFAARVVSILPERPVLGESYVQELDEMEPRPGHYRQDMRCAGLKLWVGVPAYRITAPTGEQFEILPSRYDVRPSHGDLDALPAVDEKRLRKSLRHWDAMRWLKGSTSYLAQINAVLGMEEHVPAEQRTRDNTGTCGSCFRNIKLDQDPHHKRGGHPTMALHGYRRPGDGQIRGRCSGETYPPYELSAEATGYERDYAKDRLDGRRAALAKLQDPDIEEFVEHRFMQEPKVHRKSDADWSRQLTSAIEEAKRQADLAEVEHATYAWLVDHWDLRALPTAGSKEPDYWTPAVTAVLAARKET